jgi:chromosome segregation ATPase
MAKANKKESTIELSPSDPNFLPVQYDLTQERLSQLAVEYDPKNIPEAKEKGDDAYQVVHEKTMAITKVRTNIEKVRKTLKADALAWGRKVDGEAKRLTAEVEALEAPWRKIKTDLDEAEAKAEEAARLAEQERMEVIEGRIAAIRALAEGLLGADSATIQERLDWFTDAVIDEANYGEYVEAATITGNTIKETLQAALTERLAFEQQQADLNAQQEKLAEERKALDEEKAAQKAAEAAEKARKEKEEKAAWEEIQRKQREQEEAEAAKQREAELKKRQPDDVRLRNYADDLAMVECPPLKDEGLQHVWMQADERLGKIVQFIYDNTQTPKEK